MQTCVNVCRRVSSALFCRVSASVRLFHFKACIQSGTTHNYTKMFRLIVCRHKMCRPGAPNHDRWEHGTRLFCVNVCRRVSSVLFCLVSASVRLLHLKACVQSGATHEDTRLHENVSSDRV